MLFKVQIQVSGEKQNELFPILRNELSWFYTSKNLTNIRQMLLFMI